MKEPPKFCPFCGKDTDLTLFLVEWESRSLDSTDHDNTATLDEHQCRDCGYSFWT